MLFLSNHSVTMQFPTELTPTQPDDDRLAWTYILRLLYPAVSCRRPPITWWVVRVVLRI